MVPIRRVRLRSWSCFKGEGEGYIPLLCARTVFSVKDVHTAFPVDGLCLLVEDATIIMSKTLSEREGGREDVAYPYFGILNTVTPGEVGTTLSLRRLRPGSASRMVLSLPDPVVAFTEPTVVAIGCPQELYQVAPRSGLCA